MRFRKFACSFLLSLIFAPLTAHGDVPNTPAELPGVDAETVSDDISKEVAALLDTEIPETKIEVVQTRAARALMAGHGRSLKKMTAEMATKLGIADDPKDVQVILNADPAVNAMVLKDPKTGKVTITMNAGLLGFVQNQDELAMVLGHEMTHANPNVMKHKRDSGTMAKIAKSIPQQIAGKQAEELRADLGAIRRMIDGGYNPWGSYDFFKRLASFTNSKGEITNRSLAAFASTHPDSELRMGVAKAYISALQVEENFTAVPSKYTKFPPGLTLLNWRLSAYRMLSATTKLQAAGTVAAGLAVQVATALIISPETSETLGILLRPGVDLVGAVSSVKELMLHAWDSSSAVSSSISAGIPGAPTTGVLNESVAAPSFKQTATAVLNSMLQIAAEVKNVPAEKVALVFGSLGGTGAFAKWAIDRFKNRTPAEEKRAANHLAIYQEIVQTAPGARLVRTADKRLQTAIDIYKNPSQTGQLSRPEILEFALKANIKSDYLDFDYKAAAVKYGIPKAEIVRIMRNIAAERRLARQVVLNDIIADSIPHLSPDQLRKITKQLELYTERELLDSEMQSSIRNLVMLSKERYPLIRFSTPIERLYLVNESVNRVASQNLAPNAASNTAVLHELFEQMDRANAAFRKVYDNQPRPRPGGPTGSEIPGYVSQREIPVPDLPELIEKHIDVWLDEVEVPGTRGERAVEMLTRAMNGASDVLRKGPAARREAFNQLVYDALARKVPNAQSIRLGMLPSKISRFIVDELAQEKKPKSEKPSWKKRVDALVRHDLYFDVIRPAKSVVELDAIVQEKLIKGQGFAAESPPVSWIYAHLQNRPDLIKTTEDVDLVLKRPYLWNQLGTGSSDVDGEIVNDMRAKYGTRESQTDLWKYRPEASERLQKLLLEKLESFGQAPGTFNERLRTWQSFVGRGVTNLSDSMFTQLYKEAEPKMRRRLRELSQGRIWEPRLRSNILKDRIAESPQFKMLVETSRDMRPTREIERVRIANLREVIRIAEREFDSRGTEYDEVVESVLKDIRSSALETKFAERYRGSIGRGQSDLTMRTLSALVVRLRNLPEEEKWNFILWLRGEQPATRAIEGMFPAVGPDRVARMYSLLPEHQKALVIDSVLDTKYGLLPTADINSYWGRKIINHLIGGSKSDAADVAKNRQVAKEILDSYLASFDSAGANKAQRTLVLSHMLASKADDGSNGKVLKHVLESMGASGIKIGQFIVAADLLGDEENKILRKLQDQANVPLRTRIYRDLVNASKGYVPPTKVDDLLGAASVKYAVQAFGVEDGHPLVLKILRAEATATVDQQFTRLRSMADSLVKKYGGKYGVLRSIIRASEEAVRRELTLENETRNSAKAAKVYESFSDFEVPKERLVDPTLIESEFANGGSIHDLEISERGRVASRIMEVEGDILFADADVIEFDPDRHPGNFKVLIEDGRVKIRPIDFGQFLSITRLERQQVFDLFAQAAILDKTGPTKWSVDRIGDSLGLNASEKSKLMKSLRAGFPASERTGLASYYTLLSALEDAGKPMPIQFFDFARAVVQHNQYEEMVVDSLIAQGVSEDEARSKPVAPRKRLIAAVEASAAQQIQTADGRPDFSKMDRVRIIWNRAQKTASAAIDEIKIDIRASYYAKVADPMTIKSEECVRGFEKFFKRKLR